MLVRPYSTSWGSGWLFQVLSSLSRSPLHHSFHRREAHSEAAMRRRQVALGDLILRRGRAIIEDMSKPCGHSMCFLEHRSLTMLQACMVAAICFTVENDVLHGFNHVAVLANSMVFMHSFYFEPVLSAFMCIVD